MHVQDLTPVEIADLLDAAWLADLGGGRHGLDPTMRAALVDRLCGDGDLRAESWAAWMELLHVDGCPVDEAALWLNVEFVQR